LRAFTAAALLVIASPAAAASAFDAVAFFTGRTHGEGTLREILKSPKRVSVASVGSVGSDGTLLLRQRVDVQGDKPRIRIWRLRKSGENAYAGSLSDARGPVSASMQGTSIHIRYRTTDGLSVQQWLTPASGSEGKAIDNRMTFSKLGIIVARLTERIEKR
jgi:hypothetical protein